MRGTNQKQAARNIEKKLKDNSEESERYAKELCQEALPEVKEQMRGIITKLSRERIALEEEMEAKEQLPDLSGIIDKAVTFLSNPKQIWDYGTLQQKGAVLNLAFTGKIRYKRGVGFKTADISMPFSVLGTQEGGEVFNGGA